MQTKKVRDIRPPVRTKVQKLEETTPVISAVQYTPKRGSRRPLSLLLFMFVVVGVAGVLTLHFFFAKAYISVWPYTREVMQQERVTVHAGIEQIDMEQKAIPALLISEEKSLKRLFSATGTSTEQGRAKGVIRVMNGFSIFQQKLKIQTRFLSQDGKLFRSIDAVVVPAGHMEDGKMVEGFLDVEVVAAESGEEYNIGPSNFSLPGLFGNPAYTTITGKSSEPMTGGSKTQISVVTEADLNAARDGLVAELRKEVREALENKVPAGMVLLEEAVDLQVVQAFSPIKAGASLDSFNFSAKVQGTATVFSKTDAESIAKAVLSNLSQEGEKIAEQSVQIGYENVEMNMSAHSLSFDMKASSLFYKEIDPVELKARLGGVKKEEASLSLSQNPNLQKAEVFLFPFWLISLPQDPNAIEITVVID